MSNSHGCAQVAQQVYSFLRILAVAGKLLRVRTDVRHALLPRISMMNSDRIN